MRIPLEVISEILIIAKLEHRYRMMKKKFNNILKIMMSTFRDVPTVYYNYKGMDVYHSYDSGRACFSPRSHLNSYVKGCYKYSPTFNNYIDNYFSPEKTNIEHMKETERGILCALIPI